MGVVLPFSACLRVRPVDGSGVGVSVGRCCGRWGRTQHREGEETRWQVEVRAEQFSTVGVEVRRGLGGRGRGRSASIDYSRQGNSNTPQAWNIPTILHSSLVFVCPNRRHLLSVTFDISILQGNTLTRCYK